METAKFMVSIVTDTGEIEEFFDANGFELMSTGCGSFEYVTGKDVDIDEVAKKLADMLIRVRDLRE